MTDTYIYQTVHLYNGHPRLTNAHASLLGDYSRRLFAHEYAPDVRALESRIMAAARKADYPEEFSSFIRIEVTPHGEERLVPAGTSFYNGFTLRALTPDAAVIDYDPPVVAIQSSAREAATALATLRAQKEGCNVAICCDRHGCCILADDAPLFAIRGRTVCYSPQPQSVERELILHAARMAGLELREVPIRRAELHLYDELFYSDHRGLTSIFHADGHPYMSLLAARIARSMESLFFHRK